MDNTWELLAQIWLLFLFVFGIGYLVLSRRSDFHHLENCRRTRKAMERMMNRD